jgi:hypothetical protein
MELIEGRKLAEEGGWRWRRMSEEKQEQLPVHPSLPPSLGFIYSELRADSVQNPQKVGYL